MFGIGTTETLVFGLLAVVWLAFIGRARAALIVMACLGLLTVLVAVGRIISWNKSHVTPVAVESIQIAPDGTQYWVNDQAPQSGVEHSQWTPDGKQYWPGDSAYVPPVNVGNTTWFIALRPALMIFAGVLIGIVLLLVKAASRGGTHTAAAGHSRIWPAFLALPILAFLVIGGVRYEASSSGAAAARQAAEMRESMRRQQQAFQRTFDEQRRKAHQQVAAAKAKVHQQIEQMDIHELMDKFDAPRIVLQAPLPSIGPTSGSATFLIAAATSAAESAKKEAKDNSSKATTEVKAETEAKAKAVVPSVGATEPKQDASTKADSHATPDEEGAKTEPKSVAATVVEAETPVPPVAPAPPAPPAPAAPSYAVTAETTDDATSRVAATQPEASKATLPAWIHDPPKRAGDVRREVIVTEEYESADECYRAADVYLMLKAYERLQQLRGMPTAIATLPSITFHSNGILADGRTIASGQPPTAWIDPRLRQLSQMGIGTEFLRREIVAKDPANNESRECLATVTRSVGPMKELYMQIEFTPATDRELMQFAEAYSRQERFAAVGFGAGSILTFLTIVWGLLKIDTATKGYYTKRLFLGVPAAIIAGVIAVITWMNYTF